MLHKEPDGSYKIPRIIYADAYASEMVADADLVLPDTSIWSAGIASRCSIVPSAPPKDRAKPIIKPDRDVRPSQDVLIDLSAPNAGSSSPRRATR